MRIRIPSLSPVAGALLVALGLGMLTLVPAQAAPATFYFTSGSPNGYLGDLAADPTANPDKQAPATSQLVPTQPAGPEVSARSFAWTNDQMGPSTPVFPTFGLNHTGTVSTVCLDGWFSAAAATSASNFVMRLGFYLDSSGVTWNQSSASQVFIATRQEGVFRITQLLTFSPPVNLPGTATTTDKIRVGIYGTAATNPDWNFHYNAPTRASSLTLNPTTCGGVTPTPTSTGGSGSPSATPSATPSGTPSATPSGTPSASPTPSATSTPSESPEPCVPDAPDGELNPCDEEPPSATVSVKPRFSPPDHRTLVSWGGSDPEPGTGIESWKVDVKSTTGSVAYSAAATTARNVTLTLKQGWSYKATVSAVDVAGNRSRTVSSTFYVPLDDAVFSRSRSGWSRAASKSYWYNGYSRSATKGATATRKVTAKRYDLIFTAFASGGIVEVLVNGKVVKRVDTYSRSTVYKKTVTVASYSSKAARTITLRISGTRNRASKGTWLYFDGLRAVY